MIEKLRYNDYELLLALTQSLMKGDALSVRYNILVKLRRMRDKIINYSSKYN